MAVNAKKSLVALGFKDAFLLVDQIEVELVACRFLAEFIELMGISQEDAQKFAWTLWKVLPRQRNAAALWANHLALVGLAFSRCPLAPSMYKDKNGTLLMVHVDDAQGMGKEHCFRNLVTALKKNALFRWKDRSYSLQIMKYRTAIGILLYISGDWPDIQFTVNVLSSGLTAPTKRQQKQLEHLILYLIGTRDFHYAFSGKAVGASILSPFCLMMILKILRKWKKPEVFTDSDWASCHGTRRGTSCAVLALNGSVVYSYSRRQKVVLLSSGEAEYYAAASAASEGVTVYLKNIVQFLTGKPVCLVLRCDSQAACGMIQRQGVQGVKHISLKVLWGTSRSVGH